jgi:hypothetical protein
MQLIKLSLSASLLLSTLGAEDYIHVQLLQYNENAERVSITAPSIEISKDFGTDYTIKGNYTLDTLSGASPTFYDSTSGASAYSRGPANQSDITFGGVEYDEPKRMVGAVSGTKRFENRDEVTLSGSFSNEYDYRSSQIALEALHWIDENKNQALSAGISFQKNVILVECRENSICDSDSGASKKLRADAFMAEIGITQNINTNSRFESTLFFNNEDGYLSNPFMNVVRHFQTNPTITNESRPEHRRGYGAIFKYITALKENIALHSGYRYYHDNWEINSHTYNANLFYEMDTTITLGAGVRYYIQDSAYFYSDKKDYFTDERYASSDGRLGDFDATTLSLSIDYKIKENIIYNLSANHYNQEHGITARYFTTGLKYRF